MQPNNPDLPNLSGLNLNPRKALRNPKAVDGVYCLDKEDSVLEADCGSKVLLFRNALPITGEEFEEAVDFMCNKVEDDFSMGHTVPRKQCTFGKVQYKRYQLKKPNEEKWPSIVDRVLEATKQFALQLGIENPDEYNAVHANYYKDGSNSVQPHTDAEEQLVRGVPIFSYTYIIANNEKLARGFQIYKLKKDNEEDNKRVEGKGQLADITLYSGDLLIMMGDMQEYFTHGIKKVKNRTIGARLNFTVRQFVEKKPGQPRAEKTKRNKRQTHSTDT